MGSRKKTDLPDGEEKKKKKGDKPEADITRKIRLFPNPKQKQILLNWFGAARWTYNKCLDSVEIDQTERTK